SCSASAAAPPFEPYAALCSRPRRVGHCATARPGRPTTTTQGGRMRLARVLSVTVVASAIAVLCVTGVTNAAKSTKAAGSPVVIGATIDLTKGMAPFDAPALTAAQIEIKKINAAGGVDGHPLVLKYLNTQLDPQATKQDATKLISQGAQIGWVTCDVDYSTPS